MKYFAILIAVVLAGCASLADQDAPYGSPIPAERLYWPQKVDRVVTPSGNVHVIRGR